MKYVFIISGTALVVFGLLSLFVINTTVGAKIESGFIILIGATNYMMGISLCK